MSVAISAMAPQETEAVVALMHRCFESADARLIEALLRDLFTHPAGIDGAGIVAKDGEQIVGFVMLSVGLLDTFERNIRIGVLGPLGVDPEHQRQGIARALVQALVEAAEIRNLPVVFLEGDPAFYSRVGFEPAKKYGMRKPSIRIPDAAFQCRPLSTYESWMCGTEVYPEPFWTHDCVGLREPDFITWVKQEVAEGREL